MRKSITIIVLFFSLITFGQEKEITTSDLIGYWTFERIERDPDFDIMIYKRCNFSQKGTVVRFKSDGKYSINHNWGPRRCGNERRPKNVNGLFSLDSELNKVKLNSYSAKSRTSWNLIWVDENSFGVKKPKHNKT